MTTSRRIRFVVPGKNIFEILQGVEVEIMPWREGL